MFQNVFGSFSQTFRILALFTAFVATNMGGYIGFTVVKLSMEVTFPSIESTRAEFMVALAILLLLMSSALMIYIGFISIKNTQKEVIEDKPFTINKFISLSCFWFTSLLLAWLCIQAKHQAFKELIAETGKFQIGILILLFVLIGVSGRFRSEPPGHGPSRPDEV